MRKSVWIFLLAVLVPSAVLGWLALRSAGEQQIILERQTTELYQRETENLAAAARSVIDEQRRSFAEAVRALLTDTKPDAVAQDFAARLGLVWPRKAVGFSLAADGRVLSPAPRLASTRADWGLFLREHGGFLGNTSSATVYNVPVDALTQPEVLRNKLKANVPETDLAPGAKNAPAGRSAVLSQSLSKEKNAPIAPAKPAALEKKAEVPAPKRAEEFSKLDDTTTRQRTMPRSEDEKRNLTDKAMKPATRLQPLPSSRSSFSAAPQPRAPAAAPPPAPVAATPAPTAAAPKPPSEATGKLAAAEASTAMFESAKPSAGKDLSEPDPQQQQASIRLVQPQQLFEQSERTAVSTLLPETAEFRTLSEGQNEGILARFVQDKLALIFWLRPAQAPELIFGCVVEAADLVDLWPQLMPAQRGAPEFVLALLDDRARPAATSLPGGRDWKRPFVASEIGEALPHWEATLYLMRPEQLQESALALRRTLVFLIAAMLGAIALGGWLVVADARRQFALAQQKTDFVSNVSHELKTPLTSIRMFAELMLGGRAETQAKAPQYLRIIMVEAERLTRLINNVLDFAKLERRQKRFDKKPLDLHEVIARTWESHELHLRESGFATKWEAAPPPYQVIGDEDALAQILVNLLSNAEKYSAERKEIELHTYLDSGHLCVSVLDRGLGVPAGSERKIFDAFYRAHDSLSNGIQGSGLGLTLAQRLAHEHGGEIEYRAREDGGSSFTFRIPLA